MTALPPARFTRRIALILALCTTLAGCKKKAAADEAAKPVVTAKNAGASGGPVTPPPAASGVVGARPGHYAALSAPSPTRVAKVYVSQGQRVGAGQPLVEFDQSVFAPAANAAQTALRTAERNYERAQRLANEGIVPRKDAETAAADLA